MISPNNTDKTEGADSNNVLATTPSLAHNNNDVINDDTCDLTNSSQESATPPYLDLASAPATPTYLNLGDIGITARMQPPRAVATNCAIDNGSTANNLSTTNYAACSHVANTPTAQQNDLFGSSDTFGYSFTEDNGRKIGQNCFPEEPTNTTTTSSATTQFSQSSSTSTTTLSALSSQSSIETSVTTTTTTATANSASANEETNESTDEPAPSKRAKTSEMNTPSAMDTQEMTLAAPVTSPTSSSSSSALKDSSPTSKFAEIKAFLKWENGRRRKLKKPQREKIIGVLTNPTPQNVNDMLDIIIGVLRNCRSLEKIIPVLINFIKTFNDTICKHAQLPKIIYLFKVSYGNDRIFDVVLESLIKSNARLTKWLRGKKLKIKSSDEEAGKNPWERAKLSLFDVLISAFTSAHHQSGAENFIKIINHIKTLTDAIAIAQTAKDGEGENSRRRRNKGEKDSSTAAIRGTGSLQPSQTTQRAITISPPSRKEAIITALHARIEELEMNKANGNSATTQHVTTEPEQTSATLTNEMQVTTASAAATLSTSTTNTAPITNLNTASVMGDNDDDISMRLPHSIAEKTTTNTASSSSSSLLPPPPFSPALMMPPPIQDTPLNSFSLNPLNSPTPNLQSLMSPITTMDMLANNDLTEKMINSDTNNHTTIVDTTTHQSQMQSSFSESSTQIDINSSMSFFGNNQYNRPANNPNGNNAYADDDDINKYDSVTGLYDASDSDYVLNGNG